MNYHVIIPFGLMDLIYLSTNSKAEAVSHHLRLEYIVGILNYIIYRNQGER